VTGLGRVELAQRIARDIPEGAYVNLGIGAPTLVADHLPDGLEIILHTENGLLGMGRAPESGAVDPDLINAGKQPVTALPGAAYFHHADSFGMMRGGHLDVCVLGAFQVSSSGDLANWSTGAPGAIPAVGGAMDLAIGAKSVWVMTDLLTRDGASKLVSECTYPLTGVDLEGQSIQYFLFQIKGLDQSLYRNIDHVFSLISLYLATAACSTLFAMEPATDKPPPPRSTCTTKA
jgi:3-oxoadipate CoA-transferase beta subunit